MFQFPRLDITAGRASHIHHNGTRHTENGKLAVEKCGYKSSGAHQLPEDTSHDGYELKSMDMDGQKANLPTYTVLDHHKGIVSHEQFDMVQAIRMLHGD